MGKCCSCDWYRTFQNLIVKITWPVTIAFVHVVIYSLVIVFNMYSLIDYSITWFRSPPRLKIQDYGDNESGEINAKMPFASDLILGKSEPDSLINFEFTIAHFIAIIFLALAGFLISVNLLKSSQEETCKNLKIWLAYTTGFCIIIIPYYVWRLSTSEHVIRWLLQLVITNALEGYFLGMAYAMLIEIRTGGIELAVTRTSSKFRGLQSRDSQITFVCDVTNLKTFSEMNI